MGMGSTVISGTTSVRSTVSAAPVLWSRSSGSCNERSAAVAQMGVMSGPPVRREVAVPSSPLAGMLG